MVQNIFKGIKAYPAALVLIGRLGLWKYFAIPVLISFFTAVLIMISAWSFRDPVADIIDQIWVWQWGADWFHGVAEILGGVLIIVLGLIVYKHIVMALSAPFMSPVSTAIERHFLGTQHTHRNTSNTAQLWRGIRVNVRNLTLEILITIPLLVLSLVPVLNIITTVVLFLVQAYYAGFGNMDYTLERHYGYKESVQFVKRHKGVAIGNGIIFTMMLFIPFIGVLLVLPLSVTAATSQTIRFIENKK